MHSDRLKAMADSDGQWDLSPSDLRALRWAVQRSEATDLLKDACEALMCSLNGWDDNGLQMADAIQKARHAIAFANRTKMEI
jgi:hypothetical protein